MFKLLSLTGLVLILLSACNYEPDGEYNVYIEPPEPANGIIVINDYDSIIEMAVTTTFHYQFSTEKDLNIKQVLVYIDGVKKYTLNTDDSFLIDPEFYAHGDHDLLIEVYTNSGSQSMADKVGAEGYLFSRSWKLFIDKVAPPNPYKLNIHAAAIHDGRLEITWQKYSSANFLKFVVYRLSFTDGYGLDYYKKVAEISDISDTTFTDETYIGGMTKYYVDVQGYNYNISGNPFKVEFPLPHVISKVGNGISMIITFSRCLFYNNFEEYVIYQNWQEYNTIMPALSVINNINDTVITVNGVMFNETDTKIAIATHWINHPFTQDFRQYEPVSITSASLGDSSFTFHEMAIVKPYEYIYYTEDVWGSRLYQHEIATNTTNFIKEYQTPPVFGSNHLSISPNGELLIFNDLALQNADFYNIPEVELVQSVSNFPCNGRASISNNKLVASLSYGDLYLYDINSGQFTDTIGWFVGWPYLSPDGGFLYLDSYDANDQLFKIENGKLINLLSISNTGAFVGYDLQYPDQLIYYADKQITIRSLNTLSIVRSFAVEGNPITNIDPVSGYFLVKTGDVFNVNCAVYNIATGQAVMNINATGNLFVANYILYGDLGHKLNLIGQ